MAQSWLAIDIGNTQTVAGKFDVRGPGATRSPELIECTDQIRFKTDREASAQDWIQKLAPLLNPPKTTPSKVIVATVVPQLRAVLNDSFARGCWQWIDSSSPRNFELKLPQPEQLGADRIANVAGALGRMDPPFVIVDAGTATTFCAVDAQRRYIGGSIVPGIETSFFALASKAAKLFEVEWKRPELALGTTTETQLQSGIIHAHEAMIAGMTARLVADAQSLGAPFEQPRLILTGGCGHYLQLTGQDFEFIPSLTLEGLIRLGLLEQSA